MTSTVSVTTALQVSSLTLASVYWAGVGDTVMVVVPMVVLVRVGCSEVLLML